MNRKSTVVLQSKLYVKCKVQPLVLVPDPPYSRDPTLLEIRYLKKHWILPASSAGTLDFSFGKFFGPYLS